MLKNTPSLSLSLSAPIDSKSQVSRFFTPFDLKRLESYTNNLLDYHVIMDMAPTLARQYFLGQLEPSSTTSSIKPVHMSPVQAAILCGVGLQKKTIDDLEKELDLPGAQIMALFGKVVKKCALYLNEVVTLDTRDEIAVKPVAKPTSFEEKKKKEQSSSSSDDDSNNSNNMRRDPMDEESWDPTKESLDDVLEEAGNEEIQKIKTRQKELINSWDLSRYIQV